MADVKAFYDGITALPSDYADKQAKTSEFLQYQATNNRKVVLITSGGTMIPLEKNTVRYLDNFSGGKRGAAAAEYFLQAGYSVIFLHRLHSLQPYSRSFVIQHDDIFMDFLHVNGDGIVTVNPSQNDHVKEILKTFQKVKAENRLLKLAFVSLQEYLLLLRMTCMELNTLGKNGIVFSSAAVSDFYLPDDMTAHDKIQSSQGPLSITFPVVPKMIKPLKSEWCPNAFVITFKLETIPAILEGKCLKHFADYGIQMVIGNILGQHKHTVHVYEQGSTTPTTLSVPENQHRTQDVEQLLIPVIVKSHDKFINH